MRFFKTLFERLWPRAQHTVSHSALATNEDADLACLEVPTPIPAEAVQIRREENGFPAPPSLSVDRWFYPWLLSCPDFIDKPLTDPERKILTAFDLLVVRPHTNAEIVPRLPLLIPQLMHSLKDDTATNHDLADQIAKDPALVGEIIRLANSPMYRRPCKIASLQQAIMLLGQDGLHQLIARVAFYPIFNLKSSNSANIAARRIWMQSERCALVCNCLANDYRQDVFYAYLTGLVAQIGLMVGFRFMEQILDTLQGPIPNSTGFYKTFIERSRLLSYRIISEWDFPEPVMTAIHEQAYPTKYATRSGLGAMLVVADQYSKLNLLLQKQPPPEGTFDPLVFMPDPCYRRLPSDEELEAAS